MEKGQTFRYNDYKFHYVMSFEDNGEIMHIVKYFGKHFQWWHYEVITHFELRYRLESQPK